MTDLEIFSVAENSIRDLDPEKFHQQVMVFMSGGPPEEGP